MSEFRKEPVSGDWIVMVPERAGRPHGLSSSSKATRKPTPKRLCPFEDPEKSGNWPPMIAYPNESKWQVLLIPNKYPALRHSNTCASVLTLGPYRVMEGIGYHDLVVTRDHTRDFPHLSPGQALRVLQLFQERYRQVKEDKCLEYVSAFANWGVGAGASLYHPHYQLLSLPIVPPDVAHSLRGSQEYWRAHRRCAHCDIIAHERKRKKGMIAENSFAVAFVPFASRHAYKVRIFPKSHHPYFEEAPEKVIDGVRSLLQHTLRRMKDKLGDPDYNFFIHTAPLKNQKRFVHYHWHVEAVPKIEQEGGFELGTGVDINVVLPEDVARLLR